MEQKLLELEKDIEALKELGEKHSELIKKQEKVLVDLYKEVSPIIKVIKENGYNFTHPTLKWQSSRGPILGYDNEKRDLYLFAYGDGIIKYNTVTKEESHTFFRQVVQLDMFETAYEGIKYVENMINVYKTELSQEIAVLEDSLKDK